MSKDFNKQLESKFKTISSHKNQYEKFKDFVDFSFWSLSNCIYKDQEIENKYISLASNYKKEEMIVMSEILSLLVLEMEKIPNDYLGDFLMSIGGGDDFKGQFFTPQHICDFMAELSLSEQDHIVKEKGFITLMEPACGAGAMIIGFYKAMLNKGYNPQTQLYVHSTDLCTIVYKMCYIQLSILGISATVVNGNSLTLEEFDRKSTPFYFLNNWDDRLRFHDLNIKINELSSSNNSSKKLNLKNTSKSSPYDEETLNDLKQGIMFF